MDDEINILLNLHSALILLMESEFSQIPSQIRPNLKQIGLKTRVL